MAWDSTQASGTVIDYSEWNTMVAYIKALSIDTSSYDSILASGNEYSWAYQSVKDSGNEWYAAYKHSTNAKNLFKPSSGIWQFASSQLLSGQLLNLHSARDILNWDSSAWGNSGLMWDSTLKKWKPHKSGASTGAPGATAFIDLTDVPQSYNGQVGKIPMVNATGDGLVFVDIVCINTGTKTVYESDITEDPQIVFANGGVVFG